MVRLAAPRCIIQIGCGDELDFSDTAIEPGAGQSLSNAQNEEFCVISWIDSTPPDDVILTILQEAITENEIYTMDSFAAPHSSGL